MESWWKLGEGSGYRGTTLDLSRIICAFCNEQGNWRLAKKVEKKHSATSKSLHFDTYQCGNCNSFVQVFWSSGDGLHAYHVQPWPLDAANAPDYLPDTVARFYKQAQKAMLSESYDAAAVMIRSAMQCALRENGATGGTLYKEIDSLGKENILPKIMIDWSHNLRLIGNDSAHPSPGENISESDVRLGNQFLKFLLEYLYKLPRDIKSVRKDT